jgi:hypothetical protein
MKKMKLSTPELMFIIGTRVALGAGVVLLLSDRLKPSTRKKAGIALMSIGGVTTIPAAKIALGRKPLLKRLGLPR